MKIKNLTLGVLGLACTFAWQQTTAAHNLRHSGILHRGNESPAESISQGEITVKPPVIVNFQELANYELAHPPVLQRRFIEQGEDREKEFKFRGRPVSADAPAFDIPRNTEKATVASPTPTITFNGVLDNGTLIPPDIQGAMGPTYLLQTTNQQFNIYTKSGTLQSTLAITTFFSASGGSGYFDPHVLYDATNGRYMICIDGNYSNGDGGLFLAVSQTSDPTGSWYVYSFDAAGNSKDFIDYPMMGYNTNWVVLTANDFINGSSPVYGKVYVMNRASVYSGTLGTVSTFTDQNAFTLAPAQTMDATQTTEYIVQDWNGNSSGKGYVEIGTVTGAVGSPVYSAGSQLGVSSTWSETSVNAKQSGNTNALEDGDTRINDVTYINGSLWFTHTVFLPASSPTYSGIDWWQVNPSTLAVQQFGRVYDSNGKIFYYYPSLGVNANGDALLGYSTSSSTAYSSAGYAFHAAADAVNTMETGYIYKSGVAGYYKTYGGGRNRWGDYTYTAVDPTDNSFWNLGEWANTGNNWGTAIAHVAASSSQPSCGTPGGLSTSAITGTSATFTWAAVTGANSYNVQYQVVGAGSWTTTATTGTSVGVTGLTAGTNYQWEVQAVCSSGNSAFSSASTFSTTGTVCNVPTGLAAGSLANTSATLSWTAVAGANTYSLQWKTTAGTTWTTVTGLSTNSYALTGLTACTSYQFEVLTVCSSGSSAYSAATSFTTTGCTVSYCASTSTNHTYEYIKTVKLGTINNTVTSGTGYANYTNLNTNLAGGTSNTITLTPGFTGSSYNEYFTVWIDYNHNGVFTDAGEMVAEAHGTAAVSKAFTVPTTALNGATRMRIQMQYSAYETNSCASFTYGGVQDYTVTITGNAHGDVINDGGDVMPADANVFSILRLYPNPAQDYITVEFNSITGGTAITNVYNLAGQKVSATENAAAQGFNTVNVSTATLSNGIYIVEIENNGELKRQKFVISK